MPEIIRDPVSFLLNMLTLHPLAPSKLAFLLVPADYVLNIALISSVTT